jgi:hypothetical protein
VTLRAPPRRHGYLIAAALTVLLVLGPSTVALAAWAAPGLGSAASAAAVMPTGSVPNGSDAGTSVTIRWAAATFANGPAVAGYVVTRLNADTGAPATVGVGCSGIVTATACTELSVPPGTWVYTDTPVQRTWTGGVSPESAPVVAP